MLQDLFPSIDHPEASKTWSLGSYMGGKREKVKVYRSNKTASNGVFVLLAQLGIRGLLNVLH